MSDVFISYSRQDQRSAQRVVDALAQADLECWIDVDGLFAGEEFWPEIQRAIDRATAFVFLMSIASLDSKFCDAELTHASEAGKRIVPVCLEDAIRQRAIPEPLSKRQWVFFRGSDGADAASRSLLESVQADWVQQRLRARLYARAGEWRTRNKDPSLLLRGRELSEARAWLAGATGDIDPEAAPTSLHTQFVETSRVAARRRRQRIVGASATALVTIALVGWLALDQTVKTLTNFSDGMELERIDQLTRADKWCQLFRQSFAACPVVNYSYGLAHLDRDELGDAADRFSQAISLLDPDDAGSDNLLGSALQARAYTRVIAAELAATVDRNRDYIAASGDVESAAKNFTAAGLNDKLGRLSVLRARIQLGTGAHADALATLMQSVSQVGLTAEVEGLMDLAHRCMGGETRTCESDRFATLEGARWNQNQQFYRSICKRCTQAP